MHATEEDYLITFDYHEDVSICNSAKSPTRIRAYQIKTKDTGGWTETALLKQPSGEKGPLPSILGKLYTLKVEIGEEVDLLSFVSNASISLKLEATKKKSPVDKKTITFAELDEPCRDSLLKALSSEHPGAKVDLNGLLEFEIADLPLKGHDTHTKGLVADFLHDKYPNVEFRVVPIYNALMSEIEVRNNNTESTGTFDEYVAKKSISKERFTELLIIAGAAPKEPSWSAVEQRLNAESTPVNEVRALRHAWEEIRLDRPTKRDVGYLRFDEELKRFVDANTQFTTLAALMEAAAEALNQLAKIAKLDPTYVKAAALRYFYES